MALILITVNLLVGTTRGKWDLTENKIHTLSEGSKNILNRVAEERGEDKDAFKIDARLYFTKGDERISPFVRQYASRVKELLKEYEAASKGSIVFTEINPQPDTDEEDLARQDNITRMQIGLEEFAYIGLTLSYADKSEMISLLEQGPGGRAGGLRPEAMLEYDVSSAITRLLKDESKAPTIGVMSPLQINGGFPPNLPPQMTRGQRPPPPWLLMRQLQASYGRDNIQTIDMNVPAITGELDLLIVIHPKSISEKAQFAIDQYVLGGGKVAAFLDPNHALDQGPMGGFSPPTGSSSNLDKLLPAWGVNFTDNRVVADPAFALRPPQSGDSWLTALDIQTEGLNQNDPILQQLGPLVGVHFGAFRKETALDNGPRPNITTLMHSTTNSALIDVSFTKGLLPLASFQQSQAAITKTFSATVGTNMLALKLTGKFRTAFPKGDPERPVSPKDANSTQPELPDNSLKTVIEDANPVVILVGDVDFLHDTNQQLDQFRGFRNSNMNFVLNLVDYLTGDEDLIRIRSLTSRSRPLKKLNKMKEEATSQIRKELEKTEQELEEAEKKVQDVAGKLQTQLRNAIQSGQSGVIRLQVSEEDRKKLESSQAEAEESRDRARKTIRRIKKQRREAENSLLNRIKWASTAGMPFLVTVFGVGLALRNRKRTAAK
ncbi:MAG: Gldg family protein [Verrucomicrobiota bacterium]|nr:Gldg family protein [Verrucomicrobiota bacterium]